jgi:glutathione peroxidase-family protein
VFNESSSATQGITWILSIGREMIGLYQRYGGPEFELIAVPCNQFFNQEPGSNEGEFSSTTFVHEPAFENHQMHLKRSVTRFLLAVLTERQKVF